MEVARRRKGWERLEAEVLQLDDEGSWLRERVVFLSMEPFPAAEEGR